MPMRKVICVSTVELAIRKVKKLSDRQARELLGWLAERQSKGIPFEPTLALFEDALT